MSNFFLPANGKKQQKQMKKKKPESRKRKVKTDGDDVAKRLSRRQKIMENTEIESEEEDDIIVSAHSSEGESEVEYDDERERNFREAQKLLDKIKETQKEEDVDQTLKDDAAARAGTLMKRIADEVELRDDEEISYKAHRFTPLCVAFSPDSHFVVSTGKESSIVKYNIAQKKVVGVIKRTKKGGNDQKAHYGVIFAVAISPNGKFIASAGFDHVVKIWDFASLNHVKDLIGHKGAVYSMAFQLNTSYLFTASKDRTVKMWDVDQLGLMDTMYGHQDAVHGVSVLGKQRVATAGGRDRTCRIWKVEDESQLMFTGLPHCISIDSIAMINEEYFATGSADGTIAIWSLWKKKPLVTRKEAHGVEETGNARWIVAITVLPYSDLLASGSNEGELKLWKIGADFKTLTPFFSYTIPGFINSINFSPNGKFLAVASGKEHKEGRWWVNEEAKNSIVILPVHYATDETIEESEKQKSNAFASDDDEDEDDLNSLEGEADEDLEENS